MTAACLNGRLLEMRASLDLRATIRLTSRWRKANAFLHDHERLSQPIGLY